MDNVDDNDTQIHMDRRPDMYLVIHNISKMPNIRSLVQGAVAFGCRAVFIVGQRKFDPQKHVPESIRQYICEGKLDLILFQKWTELTTHLTTRCIRLVGAEIHKDAKPIEAYFDHCDTAFLVGNEGQGLSPKQMKSCDAFVRIPQYGSGTASLNVAVAANLIMHRFHEWQRSGAKATE